MNQWSFLFSSLVSVFIDENKVQGACYCQRTSLLISKFFVIVYESLGVVRKIYCAIKQNQGIQDIGIIYSGKLCNDKRE